MVFNIDKIYSICYPEFERRVPFYEPQKRIFLGGMFLSLSVGCFAFHRDLPKKNTTVRFYKCAAVSDDRHDAPCFPSCFSVWISVFSAQEGTDVAEKSVGSDDHAAGFSRCSFVERLFPASCFRQNLKPGSAPNPAMQSGFLWLSALSRLEGTEKRAVGIASLKRGASGRSLNLLQQKTAAPAGAAEGLPQMVLIWIFCLPRSRRQPRGKRSLP